MPRRKYTDENVEFPNAYNRRNFLQEPVTLHIMKEMDVVPLNPIQYTEERNSEEDKSSPVKPLQVTFSLHSIKISYITPKHLLQTHRK